MVLWVTNANSAALLPFGPTEAEMVYMPDYCKAKSAGPNSPEYQAWAARVGSKYERIWGGLHHYCAGVNNMNRYLRLVNDPKRGYYLSRAVGEMNYTLTKSFPDDFLLAGDMYLNRGLAYQLMHKDGEAAADFDKAITIDPTKVQGYLGLADIYSKGNNKIKALEIVSSGLKSVPSSKALQRRYLSLGGKEPFPVAEQVKNISKHIDSHEVKEITAPEAAIKNSVEGIAEQKVPVTSETSGEKKTSSTDQNPAGAGAKNPYCRFCP